MGKPKGRQPWGVIAMSDVRSEERRKMGEKLKIWNADEPKTSLRSESEKECRKERSGGIKGVQTDPGKRKPLRFERVRGNSKKGG